MHNPTKYVFFEDDTFGLSRTELNKLIKRLLLCNEENNNSFDEDENLPLAFVALGKAQKNTNPKVVSLQEELEFSLTSKDIISGSPPAFQPSNQSVDVILIIS